MYGVEWKIGVNLQSIFQKYISKSTFFNKSSQCYCLFYYLLIALYYSLLRYNIIDTIDSSSTNSRRLFSDIWDEMIDAIEVMLTPTAETEMLENDVEIKDKEVKTYIKERGK